jgi:DNA-binding NarL/FixJ family response regulator
METVKSSADIAPVGPVAEKEIRVLVVDDHEVVREGLRVIFQEESDISLVGEASSSTKCLNSLSRLKPDVILMDIKMPDGDGFRALKEIREKYPDIRVIMLTGFGSGLYLSEALHAEASGFITKDCPGRLVCNAIRVVADGGTVWEEDFLHNAVRGLTHMAKVEVKSTADSQPLSEQLTIRELEVLKLLTDGYSNKGIATKLGMSRETAKKCVRSILGKMGVSNRIHAAIMASRCGMV